MAKPIIHAEHSAKKFGGSPDDYIALHDLMDNPKSAHATMKFRAIFHSAYGIFLVEKIFGRSFTNSAGRIVSVRDVAEQHVIEDLGFIPSLDEWLAEMEVKPWMMGVKKVKYKVVD